LLKRCVLLFLWGKKSIAERGVINVREGETTSLLGGGAGSESRGRIAGRGRDRVCRDKMFPSTVKKRSAILDGWGKKKGSQSRGEKRGRGGNTAIVVHQVCACPKGEKGPTIGQREKECSSAAWAEESTHNREPLGISPSGQGKKGTRGPPPQKGRGTSSIRALSLRRTVAEPNTGHRDGEKKKSRAARKRCEGEDLWPTRKKRRVPAEKGKTECLLPKKKGRRQQPNLCARDDNRAVQSERGSATTRISRKRLTSAGKRGKRLVSHP